MRYLPILLFLPLVLLLIGVILRRRSAAHESLTRLRQEHSLILIARARPFTVISAADAFDPASAPIWDTQIPALQVICSAGIDGLEVDALRPIHLSASHSYPELYELTSFDTWLNFLQREQLVSVAENRVRITPSGVEFLRCRVTPEVAV
jgi:hypothetical protein